MHMPAVLKIIIVFVSVLAVSRAKVPLGAALIVGGLVLDLWAGMTAGATALSLGKSFVNPELWLFIVMTVLIVEIGHYMTEQKNADEIIAATKRWGGKHGRAVTSMAVPAVIGFIPMPAGALFSAPFVEQAAGVDGSTPDWKSAVNYWFRHIWEYWWPLYPGVIVAMSVFEMEVWKFISAEFLYTPVAVGAGYYFLVRPHVKRLASHGGSGEGGNNKRAFVLMLPIIVVIGSLFFVPQLLGIVLPGLTLQIRKMLGVDIGLAGGIVVILCDMIRSGKVTLFRKVLTARTANVLVSLTGVLVFKYLMTASGLLPLAGKELTESGIPLVVAVAGLPFLAGMVTGLAVGFTGTSFPLVVGLMASEGSGLTPLATLVLAYGFGYAGMMLSPVHLCLLVTRDFFSGSMRRILRLIAPAVGVVVAYGILAHTVLSLLKW